MTAPTTLDGYVLTSDTVFVEAVHEVIAERLGLVFTEVNALYGKASHDGMDVELHTLLEPLDTQRLAPYIQISGTAALVTEPIAKHSGGLWIEIGQITDPWAAHTVMTSILNLLGHMAKATVICLPAASLATTPVLYAHQAETNTPTTWFNTVGLWLDDARTSSLGLTRGLAQFGFPEIQLAGAPWEPSQNSGLVRNVVANMLEKRVPIQPGIEFTLGDTALTLVPGKDTLSGEPSLDLVPSSTVPR